MLNKLSFTLCNIFIWTIIGAFLFSGSSANGATTVSSNITSNTTWTAVGGPYIISTDITVIQGATLTIEPNTIIKFGSYTCDLFVEGILNASGASGLIIFTEIRDDVGGDTNGDGNASSPGPNGWGSITIGTGGTATMNYVDIRYGGWSSLGQLIVNEGNLTLTNSTIQYSSHDGVRIQGSDPVLTDNTYSNNIGTAVSMDLSSNPSVSGVTVTGNGLNGLGVDGGTLTKDGFWDDSDIVYIMRGDITVPGETNLTVGAGQIIKFGYYTYDLFINGTLEGGGAVAAPIVMTDLRDDVGGDTNGDLSESSPAPSSWGSITIGTGGTATMDYVDIRYGGWSSSGQLIVNEGDLTLTNSTIQYSLHDGLRIQGSDPVLTDNTYSNNIGTAVSMDLSSNPSVSGVTVTGNGLNGLGVDGGTLTKDGFWDDSDIVYITRGDITVPDGINLTVGAGQIIKFGYYTYDLFINGSLEGGGAVAAPIVMTDLRDDVGGDTNGDLSVSSPAPNSWGSIAIGTGGTATMDYVDIRYGGWSSSAQLEVYEGDLSLTNSTIQYSSKDGVRIQGSDPVLTDNTYSNNINAAVRMDISSNPLISGVTVTGNGLNGLGVDGGTLTKDGFWDDSDIVYIIGGDITVPVGMHLTVGAGQIIKFGYYTYDLFINGTLEAIGAIAAPIVMTDVRDDVGGDTNGDLSVSSPAPNSWGSIIIGTGGTAIMDYVDIRYGGWSSSAQLEVYEGDLSLTNSTIQYSSKDGVRIQGSNPVLTDNTYIGNIGTAVRMDINSNPLISGVTITGNGFNGLGVDGGTLTKDGFWDDSDIVYIIRGDITVPVGMHLTVGAGQIIKFGYYTYDLFINGTLEAIGAVAAPIVMTDLRDDVGGDTNNDGVTSTPGLNSWGRIDIGLGGTATMDYVDIGYGGWSSSAELVVNEGDLTLTNSTIHHSSSYGLWTGNSAGAEITGSLIHHNVWSGIRVESKSTVTLINNTIDGNKWGVDVVDSDVTITNSLITNNTVGGVVASGQSSLELLSNNVFNPDKSNFDGLDDVTGQNGNISADPLYVDRESFEYGLQDNSPAIDAANGDSAPLNDLFFNWRHDHPGIANTGSGTPDYYDIGAIEYGGIPRLIKHDPEGDTTSPIDSIRFTFRNRMDTASFVPVVDIVSFTGPSGSLSISNFSWKNSYTLDVSFTPLYAVGKYEMVIGPDILDEFTNPMDVDGDLVYGENPEDRYTASFFITPPQIVHHSPAGVINGPVGSVIFTFDRPMDQASFSLNEDIAVFVGPDGNIIPSGMNWIDALNLEVTFDPQSVLGDYQLVVGPDISDAEGNPIDQDKDFLYGEIPGDQYKGAFTLADIVHVSGAVTEDTAWQGIIILDDNVVVNSGVTLTIEAGTIIKFNTFNPLAITVSSGGILIAEGSVAEPINFTSLLDDLTGGDVNLDGNTTLPDAGDWLGIHVIGGQATLDHVILSYGGGSLNGSWNTTAGAVVVQSGGDVILSNSIIRDTFFEGIIAWGSGEVTATNTIITGTDRGVNSDGSAVVALTNCILDNNRIGIYGHNGDYNVYNTVVSNSFEAGIYNILSSPIDIRYSNVWSATGVNYRGNITDQTGINGNLSVDPQYRDSTGGSYQLGYLSPMIDSADGTTAPDTDYMGAPRYDDPRTANTGIVSTSGEFADMGAFEFVETAESNIDLIVSDVHGPLTAIAGETVTINWSITNIGSESAVGSWHDRILFVTDVPSRGMLEIEAKIIISSGPIGPGESKDYEAEVRVPGGTEGSWHWNVKTNVNGEIFEGVNWKNNTGPLSDQVQLSVTELKTGVEYSGTYSEAGQPDWFKIMQPAGEELLITLDGKAITGRSSIYGGFESMPTQEDFDLRSGGSASPDQRLNLPVADAQRTVYIIVTPETLSAESGYSMVAEAVDFGIDSIDLDVTGNSGTTTIRISGSMFDENTVFLLRSKDGKTVVYADKVVIDDSGTAIVTFDLTGVLPGDYDVVVIKDGIESVLDSGLNIVSGGTGGVLETRIMLPETVRVGRPFQAIVEYANTGDADLPVPLIVIAGSSRNTVWLDGGCESCKWDKVHFLAVPTDRPSNGVLPPGKTYSILFHSISWLAKAEYTLYVKNGDSPDPVDWDEFRDTIRPNSADALWDLAWSSLIAKVGSTYAEYISALAEAADDARSFGQELMSVTDLLAYMMEKEVVALSGQSISGTVRRADTGQVISNENVVLENIATDEAYSVTSWFDGSFSFRDIPAGQYWLKVTDYMPDPWSQVEIAESGFISGLQVDVLPGIELGGQIVSASGKYAVEGALITVTSLYAKSSYFAHSDQEGRYSIKGIPLYSFTVDVQADAYLSPETQNIDINGEKYIGLNFALEDGGALGGTVYDANGSSVPNAKVRAQNYGSGSGKNVTASQDGSYEISGLEAGLYKLEASAAGHAAGSVENVTVTSGTTTSGVDINLQVFGGVQINVTDTATGQPVEGASIVTDAPGYWPDQVLTDASGSTLFTNLPAGEHTLWISAPGYLTTVSPVAVVAGQEAQLVAALRSSGSISGKILLQSGGFLSDIPIALFWNEVPVAMAWSGTDGAFGFHGLPDEEYTIALGNMAGFSIGRNSFTLNASDNEKNIDITLDMRELSGDVYLSGGTDPAPDVSIDLLSNGRLIDTIYTDSQGHFEFLVLEPGTYDIAAAGERVGFVQQQGITVGSGQQSTGLILTGGAATLSVTVTSPSNPVSAGNDVTLSIAPSAVWKGSNADLLSYSQVGSTTQISNLVPGDYEILVSSEGMALQRHSVSVDTQGTQLNVVLETGRTLQGVVHDSIGNPVNRAVVTITQSGASPQLVAVTDEYGAYMGNSLPTGSFTVTITDLLHKPSRTEGVDFSGSAPYTLSPVLLDGGHFVSGRITDSQGHPLYGVRVEAFSQDGVLLMTGRSGSNGAYQLGPFDSGVYTVTFHDRGLMTVSSEITLNSDMIVDTTVLGSPITIQQDPAENIIASDTFLKNISPDGVSVDRSNFIMPAQSSSNKVLSWTDRINSVRDYVPGVFGGRLEQVLAEGLSTELKWVFGDKIKPAERYALDSDQFREYHDTLMDAYYEAVEQKGASYCPEAYDAYYRANTSYQVLSNSFDNWKAMGTYVNDVSYGVIGSVVSNGLIDALDISLTLIAWQDNWLEGGRFAEALKKYGLDEQNLAQVYSLTKSITFDPLKIIYEKFYIAASTGNVKALDEGIVETQKWLAGLTLDLAQGLIDAGIANGAEVAGVIQNGILGKVKDVIGIADKLKKFSEDTKKEFDDNVLSSIDGWWGSYQGYDGAWRQHRERTIALATAIRKCLGDDVKFPPAPPGLVNLGSQVNHGLGSLDPNEKYTTGYGANGAITSDSTILYKITFENMSDATAAAQEVTVIDQLSSLLDWSTFQLVGIGFNTIDIKIPKGLQSFSKDGVHVATDDNPVSISAKMDPDTGMLELKIASVDTVTGGLPSDPLSGFLPPNDDEHHGEGYMTFTIRPKKTIQNGDVIINQASIVFDVNEPILTPSAINTIDTDLPVSTVTDLPEFSGTDFIVEWSGIDGGAGVGLFNIYVRDDNSNTWNIWLRTTETSAVFSGVMERTYDFYSIAIDNVGHHEQKDPLVEASTTVSDPETEKLFPWPMFLPAVIGGGR